MNTLIQARRPARPWYREPWPWVLIAIPATSVLMGVVMVVLATGTHDGLVADDYYKQGLAINQVLDRETRARELGIVAGLAFVADRSRVYVKLGGPAGTLQAPVLTLVHPTRAGEDQRIALTRTSAGEYEGTLAPLASGHWRLVLEDRAAGWRLQGVWQTEQGEVELAPAR